MSLTADEVREKYYEGMKHMNTMIPSENYVRTVNKKEMKELVDKQLEKNKYLYNKATYWNPVYEEFKGILNTVSEDPRKVALKNGLRQLTLKQLYRVMDKIYATVGTGVCLDEYSYEDGKFCPLAIGVGLDEAFKDPSNEKVFAVLVLMGYSVFNTRNVKGEFYTKNRLQDLITATVEVIEEKKKTFAQEVKEQNLTYFTKETKNG